MYFRWLNRVFCCLVCGLLIACVHSPPSISNPTNKIDEFAQAIESMSAEIRPEEAKQTSRLLLNAATELANEYNMASPALYHNMLVKMGLREKGLCCHWAEDLHSKLRQLSVDSLKFDWLVARLGDQLREHNTVVIYAASSSWKHGIVFDPWRKAGTPFWTKVEGDKYPWRLHPLSGKWQVLHCR